MSIQVTGLQKSFGEQVAVNNISFTAKQGQLVGFLGPNGAGKSTTMKMLTGFLRPDAGQALIEGIDVVRHPLKAKQKIGYLPESNALYPEMFVKEYLHFVASIYALTNTRQAVIRAIEETGLGLEAHKKIGALSKGYKQRVGLAAAIIHQPSVLILDEPTSGLDPNQIIEIRRVIKEHSKTKTVLLSTHIMQEVEAICDQVLIINRGNLVANTTLADLKQAKSNAAIRVRFKEALEAEWLHRLPTAESITKLDTYTWQLTAKDTEQLRKQLLTLVIDHNLNIEFMQEGETLEELFQELTSKAR